MKILVLLSRVPYPLEKGDKLRAYHQLRILSEEHEIYLVALNDGTVHKEAEEKLSKFCKEVHIINLPKISRLWNIFTAFVTNKPLQCGYFFSRVAKIQFDSIVEKVQPDHIYCQLVRVIDYVKDKNISKTLDFQDVLSKGMLRRKEAAPFYKKFVFGIEYRRLCRYERKAMSIFDNSTIITAVDRNLIPHPNNQKIHVIPNGVDIEQFNQHNEEKKYDLIFAGNMNYAPNIDAAEYLAREIFPLLKKKFPSLNLVICGATPAQRVRALASKDIIVTGWVETMATYYSSSRIFIAPMRLGTGLQNKLLEAMAVRIPCITSELAGRPLENAQNGKDIVVCDTTADYVDAVSDLLSYPDLYSQIADSGYNFVIKNYNWETATRKLSDIIKSTKPRTK